MLTFALVVCLILFVLAMWLGIKGILDWRRANAIHKLDSVIREKHTVKAAAKTACPVCVAPAVRSTNLGRGRVPDSSDQKEFI